MACSFTVPFVLWILPRLSSRHGNMTSAYGAVESDMNCTGRYRHNSNVLPLVVDGDRDNGMSSRTPFSRNISLVDSSTLQETQLSLADVSGIYSVYYSFPCLSHFSPSLASLTSLLPSPLSLLSFPCHPLPLSAHRPSAKLWMNCILFRWTTAELCGSHWGSHSVCRISRSVLSAEWWASPVQQQGVHWCQKYRLATKCAANLKEFQLIRRHWESKQETDEFRLLSSGAVHLH